MSNIPNGVVLWKGRSSLAHQQVLVVLTGLSRKSANPKTGNMLQAWVLVENTSPISAIHSGADRAICGNCPLRGSIQSGRNRNRACYVNVGQAPQSIWNAYQRGSYPRYSRQKHAHLVQGRAIRFGAYGDPTAIPIAVWRMLSELGCSHTAKCFLPAPRPVVVASMFSCR